MTPEQQKTAQRMLNKALDTRVRAAELYRECLEYVVPLVEGDTDCIRDARRAQAEVAAWVDQTKAALPDATAEAWAETFRQFKGA